MRKTIFQNKKGIELSINFIVMLILAIVGFAVGIVLIPKLLGASKDINQQLDDNSRDYLMNMAMEGKVAVYTESFETKVASGRAVGLGIMNVGATQDFTIGIRFVSGQTDRGETYTMEDITKWVMVTPLENNGWYPYHIDSIEVARNDRYIESILFRAPSGTPKGKYTFAILVKRDANSDGFSYNDVADENYAGSKLVTITVV